MPRREHERSDDERDDDGSREPEQDRDAVGRDQRGRALPTVVHRAGRPDGQISVVCLPAGNQNPAETTTTPHSKEAAHRRIGTPTRRPSATMPPGYSATDLSQAAQEAARSYAESFRQSQDSVAKLVREASSVLGTVKDWLGGAFGDKDS